MTSNSCHARTKCLTINSNSSIAVIADKLSDTDILKCLLDTAKGYQLSEYSNNLVKAMCAGEAWVTR